MRHLVFVFGIFPRVFLHPLGGGVPRDESMENVALAAKATDDQHDHSVDLHGRFLWLTDMHPDDYYKEGSTRDSNCHDPVKKDATAGHWGQPLSLGQCDTPWELVEEIMAYIDRVWRDKIDFVIWTGDSARHDYSFDIPRTKSEILSSNQRVADMFAKIFGKRRNEEGKVVAEAIPVVPTFGNNDIYPHNIMLKKAHPTTSKFAHIWKDFIPEDEIHLFADGGYFSIQIIPDRLAAISLNTMYFFSSNSAISGCNRAKDPGYVQFEWLNAQLELYRFKGMKVIITGHVPPGKKWWYNSCLREYILTVTAYRDIIVSHHFGHDNMDFFYFLHKTKKNNIESPLTTSNHLDATTSSPHDQIILDQLSKYKNETYTNSSNDISTDTISGDFHIEGTKTPQKLKKFFQLVDLHYCDLEKSNIDSLSAESLSKEYFPVYSGPSVIPEFYPTFRIVEYNITDMGVSTGPNKTNVNDNPISNTMHPEPFNKIPIGPAFVPQSFTQTKYLQYFLNITKANQNYLKNSNETIEFELEYDTSQPPYSLKTLTMSELLSFALRVAKGGKVSDMNDEDSQKMKESRKAFISNIFVSTHEELALNIS